MGFRSHTNDKIYTDVYSVFISGNDVYAVGSLCTDGSSLTDVPTLWINGVAQTIGNMGNFNRATSVFVEKNDIYIAISEKDSIPNNQDEDEDDYIDLGFEDIDISGSDETPELNYDPKAILWKNGVRQLMWNGVAECVYVSDKDVYVVGEMDQAPVLWNNGNLQVLASNGSALSVIVHGDDVYVAGYLGSIFNGEAVLWKNGEMSYLGKGLARSVYIANNGDVYVAGTINMNNAALWKNGVLIWSEQTYVSDAYSMTITDNGKIIIGGNAYISGWDAVVWVDGTRYDFDDKIKYQVSSVVADGDNIYVGGDGKGDLWPVWKYEEKSGYNADNLKRVK